jgi:hypothetical protein
MVGSQFHPEFRSRPNRPHPLFNGFMRAVVERSEKGRAPAPAFEPHKRRLSATPRPTRAR